MIKSYKDFLENLSLADVGGIGAVSLGAPNSAETGSGGVPAGRKKKKKKKTISLTEGKFDEAIEGVEVSLLDTKSLDDVALVISTALIKSYGSNGAKDVLNLLRNMIR